VQSFSCLAALTDVPEAEINPPLLRCAGLGVVAWNALRARAGDAPGTSEGVVS
jgi:hypothetical protein